MLLESALNFKQIMVVEARKTVGRKVATQFLLGTEQVQ